MYNDSQYFRHSSDIICHAGKKGMKWGQGPFSKLKGYVAKTIDEKITGKSAQAEADYYKRRADQYSGQAAEDRARGNEYFNKANGYEKDIITAKRALKNTTSGRFEFSDGSYLEKYGNGPLDNETKARLHQRAQQAAQNSKSYRSSARMSNRAGFRMAQEGHKYNAKAASAQRRANKSLFGRARLIFGNPKKKRG